MRSKMGLAAALAVVLIAAVVAIGSRRTPVAAAQSLQRPVHIVVVVMENRSSADILNHGPAPFLNQLAKEGAVMTNSYAITHPSLPNYLALFSGSTQGVTSDVCNGTFAGRNLASSLAAAHRSFVAYVQDLPRRGFSGCHQGQYTKLVTPWQYFRGLPAAISEPLTAFPTNHSRLPNVSFVTPNLLNDMHNGSVARGDQWLRSRLASYATWALTHNSLLVITWDEDDRSLNNHIPTIIVGSRVKPGRYGQHITHYNLLRTLTGLERIAPLGLSVAAKPIDNIWTHQ